MIAGYFEEQLKSEKLSKHQQLAIILRNLQKNLDNLKLLVRKEGKGSKRKGDRRRRRKNRRRNESDEKKDDE